VSAPRRPDPARGRSRRTVAVLLAVFAIVTAVATVATAQVDEDEVPDPVGGDDPETVSRGVELYGQHCIMCHGAEGRGTERAASIREASPALVDFVIRTGRMPLPRDGARIQRREPVIDERGREAIVAYIRTFAAQEPEIPDPDPEAGDLVHGRELYETHCIACHSPFGMGIAISQEDLAPAVHDADEVEIAQAVRAGPGVMPRFGEATIDDDDLDSLIQYVMHLRDRPQPGGITFGRGGPVGEGLLAWIVGMGALLLVAYFIGERRVD
jgi:ubiquinol-cytochrome c reductase cytochrome c subunit